MKIKELRLSKGYKQKDIARKIGVKVTTLCNWEAGISMPSCKVIPLLARVLDVSVEEIVSAVNETNNKEEATQWVLMIKRICFNTRA